MTDPTSYATLPVNLAAYCLAAAATAVRDKDALIVVARADATTPDEVWTFAALEDAVLRVAAALEDKGIARGARLVIRLDNTSSYAILFMGALAAGIVAVPTSSQLTAGEATFLLEDSGAAAVALAPHLALSDIPDGVLTLTEAEVTAMQRHARRGTYAPTLGNDPAYLLYTSGTTATPKGVVHGHRVGLGRRPTYQSWYRISADDRMLHAGAFNWTYTLGTGLIDPWANQATSIIFTGEKTPDVWPKLIVKTGATLFATVPSLIHQILKYAPAGPIDLGALRHGLIAGEKPQSQLFEDWSARTGTELYEALGMSEISTYVSTAPGMKRKPGSAGKAQEGRRIAILPVEGGIEPLPPGEEGLLAVHRSDPGLMLGYWNRPDEEAQAFRGDWFIGGDLAVIDAEGYVTHTGRANDIMKALGYRVSPQEVEAVLSKHPSIAEVACTEITVAGGLSVIGAFVVPREGVRRNAGAILAYAAETLARYKCPREVIYVDALPRTANGKVKRQDLKQMHALAAEHPSS